MMEHERDWVRGRQETLRIFEDKTSYTRRLPPLNYLPLIGASVSTGKTDDSHPTVAHPSSPSLARSHAHASHSRQAFVFPSSTLH